MKAVNLIPVEERRGGAGKSGGAYALLAGLGLLLVLVAAYVLVSNSINQSRGELVRVSKEAARAEAEAQALKPYRDFATLREKRVATVRALATSRFDWERTMRQIARVLPANVSLTSLAATVSPAVSAGEGGGAGGTSLRGAINAPAVELVGCTSSQSEVARVMSRLRRMTDVTRVSLSASEKSDQQGAASGNTTTGVGSSTDCKMASGSRPQFNITVFFRPLAGAAQAAPGAPGAPAPPPTPAPQGSAAQPGGGAQPVSTPGSGRGAGP